MYFIQAKEVTDSLLLYVRMQQSLTVFFWLEVDRFLGVPPAVRQLLNGPRCVPPARKRLLDCKSA